jgi:hypothetical protein
MQKCKDCRRGVKFCWEADSPKKNCLPSFEQWRYSQSMTKFFFNGWFYFSFPTPQAVE